MKTRKQRLAFTSKLISRIAVPATNGNREEAYRILFDGFTELGGLYVKFLQILSARHEFRNLTSIPAAKRAAVFDGVKPDPLDIHQVLASEIGPTYNQYLLNIQPKPFAAGSFGQVYFATHADGNPVIIKVLRPSIVKNIKFDLKVLRIISRLIDASPFARTFKMKDVFKDFKEVVLTEMDYPREVQNAVYFYDYYKDHPNVVIPKSYPTLSSSNVLTQEFIPGMPLTDLLVRYEAGEDIMQRVVDELGSDLRTQLYALGHELLYSTLVADKIVGDPHAGNIKILPDNKVGLFDFGITADPPSNRLAYKDIMKEHRAIYGGDFDPGRVFVSGMKFFANRQFRALNTVATAVKNNDPNFDLMVEIENTVNRVFEQSASKMDIEKFIKSARIAPLFRETINEGNRFALDIEIDGTVMMKAADTYVHMLDKLGLREDLMPKIYDSVFMRVDNNMEAQLKGASEIMDLERAVEIVGAWMQDLIERDPLTFHSMVSRTRSGLGGQNDQSEAKAKFDEALKEEVGDDAKIDI